MDFANSRNPRIPADAVKNNSWEDILEKLPKKFKKGTEIELRYKNASKASFYTLLTYLWTLPSKPLTRFERDTFFTREENDVRVRQMIQYSDFTLKIPQNNELKDSEEEIILKENIRKEFIENFNILLSISTEKKTELEKSDVRTGVIREKNVFESKLLEGVGSIFCSRITVGSGVSYEIEMEIYSSDKPDILRDSFNLLHQYVNGSVTEKKKKTLAKNFNKIFGNENFDGLYTEKIPRPIDVTKDNYNLISKYTVTDKADGIPYFCSNDHAGSIHFISGLGEYTYTTIKTSLKDDLFVLQGEYVVNDAGKGVFLVFDYIDEILTSDIETRLKKCQKIVDTFESEKIEFRVKKFYFNDSNTIDEIHDSCLKIMTHEYDYKNEGIVFTPKSGSGNILKWKPELTIDVINSRNGLITRDGTIVSKDGFNPDMENEILEFLIRPTESGSEDYIFQKIRLDKIEANNINIVKIIKDLIRNPIDRKTFFGKSFWYYRIYHNQVKNSILSQIERGSLILDIGSGHGGDIHKWKNKDLNVIAVEPNKENVKNLRERLIANTYANNVAIINDSGEKLEGKLDIEVDAATLMFSLSFFEGDSQKSLINLLKSSVKHGGKVVGVTIDKMLLLDTLGGRSKIGDTFEGRSIYSISLKGNERAIIDVGETRTIEENQEENLFDFNKFVLEMKSAGFILNDTSRLMDGHFLSSMSKNERELSSCYRYFTFTRCIVYPKYSPIVIPDKNPANKYAYVALIFGGNSYEPGIIGLSNSIRYSGSKHDIVVMHTNDVNPETFRKYVTHCVEVPYLNFDAKPLLGHKQTEIYLSWIDKGFTKWCCLMLTQYEKVLFLDLDAIVAKGANVDKLFELPTPAAPFDSPYAYPDPNKPEMKPHVHLYKNKNGKNLQHGDKVLPHMIDAGLYGVDGKGSFALMASSVLLSPNIDDFNDYVRMMELRRPYGVPSYSMADETSLTLLYHLKLQQPQWTHIDMKFNMVPWREHYLLDKNTPAQIYHYIGLGKPWIPEYLKEYPDVQKWWDFYQPPAAPLLLPEAEDILPKVPYTTMKKFSRIEFPEHTKYAYVIFIFGGNDYIPGVKALAASMRKVDTEYDLVCLHTPDVDPTDLKIHCDHVVEVPYLRFESKHRGKHHDVYQKWIEYGLTRMHGLRLTSYKKVFLLDLDQIFLENADAIFKLDTPAVFLIDPFVFDIKNKEDPYYKYKHGEKIDEKYYKNLLIIAAVLLEPSLTSFHEFIELAVKKQPFDFPNNPTNIDEAMIMYYIRKTLADDESITRIGDEYMTFPASKKKKIIINFQGIKPWKLPRESKESGVDIWWKNYDRALKYEKK